MKKELSVLLLFFCLALMIVLFLGSFKNVDCSHAWVMYDKTVEDTVRFRAWRTWHTPPNATIHTTIQEYYSKDYICVKCKVEKKQYVQNPFR